MTNKTVKKNNNNKSLKVIPASFIIILIAFIHFLNVYEYV